MPKQSTILITGSSQGIGFLTAKTLARQGHQVFASMRDFSTKNQEVAAQLVNFSNQVEGEIIPIELDVTSEESCRTAVEHIEKSQALDVLINNAGIMPVGLTEAYTLEQIKGYFDVNLYGMIGTTRAVLPMMRERKQGRLIHLSSSAGRLALPYFGIYCASKWAMEAYAESLHYELASYNIETCIVEPSGHATGLVKSAPTPDDIARVQDYGSAALGGDKLLNMFEDMFAKSEPETDAQNVANSLSQLTQQADSLPLRLQIGSDMGVAAINQAVAPIQQNIIDQLQPVYQTTQ